MVLASHFGERVFSVLVLCDSVMSENLVDGAGSRCEVREGQCGSVVLVSHFGERVFSVFSLPVQCACSMLRIEDSRWKICGARLFSTERGVWCDSDAWLYGRRARLGMDRGAMVECRQGSYEIQRHSVL